MDIKKSLIEIVIIILASLVLAVSIGFRDTSIAYTAGISFLIIIGANILIKKTVGYFLEINVRTKFWSWYQYGFRKDSHFKKPVPMIWIPLLLSLFTRGVFWWLAVLEFDVTPKTERVAKRHGLYRFTQVTEWHIAWIAAWGIILNLLLGIIGYIAGFELFARLSIYFAAWSLIPLSGLDGSKIFFSSRGLWITLVTITLIILGWGLTVI
ncbi:MAG: hypothetical protein KKF50_04495 [Nanoarchaeota archaeon]|nr:hypothetical protein [Nanoarchaeota archaeon]